MKELAGKLAALDPDAGAALRVIAYFDRLVEGRASLEALVRGAAVLSGCPARLVDEERGVRVRVTADGVRTDRRDGAGPVDPAWMAAPLAPGGAPALWLERPGPPGGVHAMVLERASAAAREVLDRTRGRAPAGERGADPASVEVLLDRSAPEPARRRAARLLGLRTTGTARAVAPAGAALLVEAVPVPGGRAAAAEGPRAGIGPAVPVLDLPESAVAARTALRFTAEGTDRDPGPRTVYADELGGLAPLAETVGPGTEPIPDVRALERAVASAPWAARTLHSFAFAMSLRTAAAELTLHHSTLQGRLTQAERWLGWPVHDPRGRLRLQLALTLWRLHRTHGL
ncbi:helix-turn-helix domain-containing protein [Streptomyces sp. NRRL F-5135]|uniref:helix-turn-helix domain-containing protein n=1 Tax=Streptomyces sp. NRRL F-5135 TaxID=1463858 RepID=UPI0004CA5186|nr:helix-turn-helix domain-containing protein [Streptomyces sp. NRRL F-5135]